MKILVTGSAGFIGSTLTMRLLARGDEVLGIDNHNDYYDPAVKEARLARFAEHPSYSHLRIDLADKTAIEEAFATFKPQRVVNLAAQAGVRYSIENPMAYIDSNLVGFAHILEGCRHHNVEHLVYASSSSVYGSNTAMPFSAHHNVDHPLSLYAATKKANELMAHTYSHLYRLPTTGLRFFTVYGPWGRPDMALFLFTKAILEGKPIDIFNHGNMVRDFTYIDDIVEGVIRVLDKPATPNLQFDAKAPDPASSDAPYRTFNIGNGQPTPLMEYITSLESALGITAIKNYHEMQPGDVPATSAETSEL
jgi:UDP-glucuronate 4-epimerase